MPTLTIKTQKSKQVIDITDRVNEDLKKDTKVCHLFVKHTTAALTCADLDPGTDLDMLDAFYEMIPKLEYRHPHDPSHVPDHILAALVGPAVTVPVKDGKLDLGTWQRVVLFEFDGPREREVVITTA
ncbi:MAG: secondary thiamine-phosphate synthase enzyme YjbQ [Patescibacteria group bacterium]